MGGGGGKFFFIKQKNRVVVSGRIDWGSDSWRIINSRIQLCGIVHLVTLQPNASRINSRCIYEIIQRSR